MISRLLIAAIISLVFLSTAAHAQKAELTINFNETFFDALLDSVFNNVDPLEFPLSAVRNDPAGKALAPGYQPIGFTPPNLRSEVCTESVRLLREMNGVRTAVRFRDGKVYVPL